MGWLAIDGWLAAWSGPSNADRGRTEGRRTETTTTNRDRLMKREIITQYSPRMATFN